MAACGVSAVLSLKQELERLLHSYQRVPGVRYCIYDDSSLLDWMLRYLVVEKMIFPVPSTGSIIQFHTSTEQIIQFHKNIIDVAQIAANFQLWSDGEFEMFCESALRIPIRTLRWSLEIPILCDKISLMDSLLRNQERDGCANNQQLYANTNDMFNDFCERALGMDTGLIPYDFTPRKEMLHIDGDDVTLMAALLRDRRRHGCANNQPFSTSFFTDDKFRIFWKSAFGRDTVLIPYDTTSRKEMLQVLYEEVSLMDCLLRDSSGKSYNREMMSLFQNRIADVVDEVAIFLVLKGDHKAFFLQFDLNSKKNMRTGVESDGWIIYPTKLQKITQQVACINEELKKIHLERGVLRTAVPPPSDTGKLSTSHRSQNKDIKLVGLEKDLEVMLDCLTGMSLKLLVFPVIGMGGIGKTTFARNLYDHPLVLHHFHTHAWIAVSQEYQLKEMLLGLLRCIMNLSDEMYEWSSEQLKEQLYRCLKSKRYLIMLDDVWDNKAWDDLKGAFPDDKNGSRIMLASRIRDVAIHASPDVLPHCLRCLSQEESWELLCSKIFANGSCPSELVTIGKQIAYKCQGLPLAIVVVGGLLSKTNKASGVWEEVAQNVGSFVTEDPEHCQSILALSYNHLPDPLKACFLYMGVFPEDYEIPSKKLMCLWIAEGFVQPEKQKMLEDVAEDYLEDLIARNLIMVKGKRANGRIKTCGIHDLMRDLCLRESQKEGFLQVIHGYGETSTKNALGVHKYGDFFETDLHTLRRLAFYSNIRMCMKLKVSFPSTRSFFCFEALRQTDLKGCSGIGFKLLKVLDIMHVHLLSLPPGIIFLIHLRYLALTIQNFFPISELFRLHNLQTCIVDCEWTGYLPRGFWYMTELRHLHLKRRLFREEYDRISGFKVLENLQSVSMLSPQNCTREIFLCFCNLKKLGVSETEEDRCRGSWLKNLFHLKQLETLKYIFSSPFASPLVKPERLPSSNVFPQNLMKITLSGTSYPWEDMLQLSMLPKLEVLKLKNYAFSGAVWKLGAICFNYLKFLLIGSTNLQHWDADGSNFPRLEHLVLRHCRLLTEIPYGIGEAPLLEKIELHCCGDSAAASAREMQEEQRNLGNDFLAVYITTRHL